MYLGKGYIFSKGILRFDCEPSSGHLNNHRSIDPFPEAESKAGKIIGRARSAIERTFFLYAMKDGTRRRASDLVYLC